MTTTLYGISNCDTIKKAQKWLTENHIEFTFHDYRKQGIDASWLRDVVSELGWEVVLNQRGTTYRQLDESDKANLDAEKAIALMLEHVAMIKRPILLHKQQIECGFKPNQYAAIFA